MSTHSPLAESLRRVLVATRRLHTAVPSRVERSSGSWVRFPVRTTRLMLVPMRLLLFGGGWSAVWDAAAASHGTPNRRACSCDDAHADVDVVVVVAPFV